MVNVEIEMGGKVEAIQVAQKYWEIMRELLAECYVLREQRTDLIRYLNTDKFQNDTTVQTVDVLTRLGAR